jgi:toxin ParE1/3/4
VKNYLIFYRPLDEGIEIMRILHGSQDIKTIFPDED